MSSEGEKKLKQKTTAKYSQALTFGNDFHFLNFNIPNNINFYIDILDEDVENLVLNNINNKDLAEALLICIINKVLKKDYKPDQFQITIEKYSDSIPQNPKRLWARLVIGNDDLIIFDDNKIAMQPRRSLMIISNPNVILKRNLVPEYNYYGKKYSDGEKLYVINFIRRSKSDETKVESKVESKVDLNEEKKEFKIRDDYKINKSYKQFYSNAAHPLNKLSNFAYIKDGIEIDGLIYPSTEHAFQAQKFIDEDKKRFSITGDIGDIDKGFSLMYPPKEVEDKKKFWMKKGNIGILAKMAVADDKIKKFKLRKVPYFKSSDENWMKILDKKYDHKEFKDILLSTGDNYLLEFDKGAKRRAESGDPPYYAGLIDDDLNLYGTNKMGIYLMNIRDSKK